MPDVADIKRNVVVPNVFCALLDIHAYTEFCQRNRHNVSMLRALDDMIHHDMREIAAKNACLSTRAAGDNIIILGSSPADVIHASLGVIDSFSRRRVLQATALAETRKGNATVVQDFHVSAGIAGGLHYNSLIVTQDGDISGSVVNTAARLQGFAGTVAPDRSKVMITSHVHAGYTREIESDRRKANGLVFFDCGKIGFKGTNVGVYELLYAEREMKKVRYQKEYTDVFETKKKGLWSDRLVPDATRLVAKVLATVPISGVETLHEGMPKTFTNAQVIRLCEHAIELYESEKDHREVSGNLQQIVEILSLARGFDPLVLIHFTQIVSAYDQMVREFEAMQYEKIIENQIGLFSAKERSVIDHAARLERMRDALIERGKKTNNIYSPTMLWKKIVSEFDGGLQFDVYSGKR